MGILRIDHPDVRHFIHAKDDGVSAQRFNLSLAVTDAFIDAAASGGSIDLVDPHADAARGSADAASPVGMGTRRLPSYSSASSPSTARTMRITGGLR